MSLVKRTELFPNMPLFFNDFFTKDLWNWGLQNHSQTNTTIPAVNIRETADTYEVEVAAPGMKKEDFNIELDGNTLTIRSEKREENEQKDGERYTRREFSYQAFQRMFTLPKDVVDVDKIEARYDQGLLRLVVPKKEEAKQRPPKLIQIS